MTTPNFSADRIRAYPWSSLRSLSRDEAAVESALARWLSASSSNASASTWSRMRKLLRLDPALSIVVRSVGVRSHPPAIATTTPDDSHAATKLAVSAFTPTAHAIDPYAAVAIVCIDDVAIEVIGSSAGVRAIVQRLLGGPDELAAPRPLGVVEQSLWTVVVATALEDLGIAGHVWPQVGSLSSHVPSTLTPGARLGASPSAPATSSLGASPTAAGATRAQTPASAARAARAPGASPSPGSSPSPGASPSQGASPSPGSSPSPGASPSQGASQPIRISFDVRLGDIAIAVEARVPREIALRGRGPIAAPTWAQPDSGPAPAARAASEPSTTARTAAPPPTWVDRVRFDLPITVGRCAIHRDDLARLAIRSLVTLDRPAGKATADLEIFGGTVGLSTRPGALVAEVATGYVRRDMALPDEAHTELTVALGTTQLTLRQITELAIGQVVQLGRPLGGPFELRVAGRVLGRGELVDVDGELAVRIVSLGD